MNPSRPPPPAAQGGCSATAINLLHSMHLRHTAASCTPTESLRFFDGVRTMKCLSTFSAVAALALVSPLAAAQSATATPATSKATKSQAATPANSRQQLQNQAKGMALATKTVQSISPSQLDIASRVHTGKAECEFDQTVSVEPVEGKPGHFHVGHKKATYTMVPEETTTGAVRLEDKKAGVMWLQIANKSMLMNSKIGQRMVDSCTHPAQRVASKG
jgi:hypothetical protein